MSLTKITEPIRRSLEQVEAVIAESLRTENVYVQQMVDYLAHAAGKRVRPILAVLCAQYAGRVGREVSHLGAAVEMLHVATLIHDDIIDNSAVRRKQKTLNFKWGNETSVLMGDYVFAASFHCMTRTLPKDVLEDLADTTRVICRGEISETFHRFNPDLTEEQYLAVVRDKTASLIAASCRLGARLGGASRSVEEALGRFGEALGTAFQIIDDNLDYVGDRRKVGKPVLSDLKEGKLTLPVIHLRDSASPADRRRLRKLVLKKVKSSRDLAWVSERLERHGSVAYGRERAAAFVREAHGELARLNGHRGKEQLTGFAEFLLARDY